MDRNIADQRSYIGAWAFKVFLNMLGQYISLFEIVSIFVLRNQCFKIEKNADRLYKVIRKEPAYYILRNMAALIYIIEQSSQNRGHKLKVSTALFKRDKFLKKYNFYGQIQYPQHIIREQKNIFL